MNKDPNPPEVLKGWKQIADFLGEPVSVVQRWAADGMPVQKQGRHVTTSSSELNEWLGRESGKPIHVVTSQSDLSAELKRGLAFARQSRRSGSVASAIPRRSRRKAS